MADACSKSGRSAMTCRVRGLSLPIRLVQTFLVETRHKDFNLKSTSKQREPSQHLWYATVHNSRLHDLKECGLRMDELSVKCLLYADDQVILAPSTCRLQMMVNKTHDSVKKRGMEVNVGMTKIIVFERGESMTENKVLIEGEKVEQVKEFIHWGRLFTNDGKHDRDTEKRVDARNNVNM
ncbi:hypothetical protein EVAR_51244_1 [Eumeta japonica]|uniref:Reverse transcriptase domain-containing protein n=1 Tax=Eumeta variegata TaxID=151549 RepID=A0A4C1X534_EUMVA|nr:hypothetical protein EVAR_51244_1 [Eumeta japonica]